MVRFDDPFDDEYDLPKEKWKKYLGTYRAFGKTNPFFKEMEIEVFVGSDGELQLRSTKEGKVKGHYKLQFSNESRATLRNISLPREIQFKLFPDGSIGGLYMFGSNFKKRDASIEARYEQTTSADGSISFLFPQSANKVWDGLSFKGTFAKLPNVGVAAVATKLQSESFDNYISQQIGDNVIRSSGVLKKKNVRGGIWTEKSVITQQGNEMNQSLFVFYQDPVSGKQLQLTLSNPWGEFTSALQEVVMYIQDSISF